MMNKRKRSSNKTQDDDGDNDYDDDYENRTNSATNKTAIAPASIIASNKTGTSYDSILPPPLRTTPSPPPVATTTTGASSTSADENYGSKEYWEKRYETNWKTSSSRQEGSTSLVIDSDLIPTMTNNDGGSKTITTTTIADTAATTADHKVVEPNSGDNNTSTNETPGFAWYFSYTDLWPLLLPLIVGSRDEDNDADWNDDDDDDDDDDSSTKGVDDSGWTEVDEGEDEMKDSITDEDIGNEDGVGIAKDGDHPGGDNENEPKDDDDADTEPTTNEDDDNDDPNRYEAILDQIKNNTTMITPPKSILEIGCGDAPLGEELRDDLLHLEQQRRQQRQTAENGIVKFNLLVDRIVCFDYSKAVIDMMNKRMEQEQERKRSTTVKERIALGRQDDDNGLAGGAAGPQQHNKQETNGDSNNNTTTSLNLNNSTTPVEDDSLVIPLHYKVHDARNLPYNDGEFDVIIDKGTLDAMISDEEDGKESCIQIVAEAARLLSVNGYILIVSHLNANTNDGLHWLENVVAKGLRCGDGKSDYRIEVHSKEEDDNDDNNNDDDDNPSSNQEGGEGVEEASEESFGPAVYIIRKITASDPAISNEEVDHMSRVDIKFFGY